MRLYQCLQCQQVFILGTSSFLKYPERRVTNCTDGWPDHQCLVVQPIPVPDCGTVRTELLQLYEELE
jgi:hypothetical protein